MNRGLIEFNNILLLYKTSLLICLKQIFEMKLESSIAIIEITKVAKPSFFQKLFNNQIELSFL